MSTPPANPKIYHITHVDNLAGIIAGEGICSDARRLAQQLPCSLIGMSEIKQRRLDELDVGCHPGTKVGQYVPFYFCPRSIMLYIIHRGNHPSISFGGGQAPIVHLQADLYACLDWANENHYSWAFSPTNAGARYTVFYKTIEDLAQIDWEAVANRDFRSATVKEGKQAEFLFFDWFPWRLVEHVGVFDQNAHRQVSQAVNATDHLPSIRVENGWYY